MRRITLLCIFFIAVLGRAQQPPAVNTAAATAFLRHLYGLYEHPPTPLGPDILVKHPEQVFTPDLLALMRHDQRRAGPGNVGNLDYDPICVCQDNGGMHLTQLQVTPTSPTEATANVTLTFPEPATLHATLYLRLTLSGWRIYEISTRDVPSLRALLK
jgi:hypothetical protein